MTSADAGIMIATHEAHASRHPRELPRAEFTKFLKRELRKALPGRAIRVRGSTGTAWSWINIESPDASYEEVRAVVGQWDTPDSDIQSDYFGSGYKLSIRCHHEDYLKAERALRAMGIADDLEAWIYKNDGKEIVCQSREAFHALFQCRLHGNSRIRYSYYPA
jgi:hypothetical protein